MRASRRALLAALLVAAGVRVAWGVTMIRNPSADDAFHGLMAEAIREGRDFPLLQWRLNYGGTVGSAWALAGLSAVFGPSAALIPVYGICLAIVQLLGWVGFAERVRPGSGAWVALLVGAAPPLMTSSSLMMPYVEYLTLSPYWLWLVWEASTSWPWTPARALAVGGAAGYLFYSFPVALVLLPAVLAIPGIRALRRFGWVALGGCLGVAPLVIANVFQHSTTVRRLGGRWLAMGASEFRQQSPAELIGRLFDQLLLGVRQLPALIASACSTESVPWVVGAVAAATVSWLAIRARSAPSTARAIVWIVVAASLLANAMIGRSARSRYFVPAYFNVAWLGGVGLVGGGAAPHAAAIALSGLNLWQHAQAIRAIEAPPPYGVVMAFLRERGVRHAYADYWTALPLTMRSRGALRVSAAATDPDQFYDLTVALTAEVDRAEPIAYIFRMDRPTEVSFANELERVASSSRVRMERAVIGPFKIYWEMSRTIRPHELRAADAMPSTDASGVPPR